MRVRHNQVIPEYAFRVDQFGPSGAYLWSTPYYFRHHATGAAKKAAFRAEVVSLKTNKTIYVKECDLT